MQALRKIEGKWVEEQPEDLTKWLCRNDGTEAVVKDKGITYCATEELKAAYEAKGKKAAMFYDLGKKLHESSPAPSVDPSADNPYWCATYSIVCSEREECREDCCYKSIGG